MQRPAASPPAPATGSDARIGLTAEAFAARVADHVERRRRRLGLPAEGFDPAAAAARLATDDLRLATAADLGCADAWAQLAAKERPRLLRLLRRHAGPGEAEAICSDVLADLCLPPPRGGARTLLGTYDGSGPLWAWLGTIALRRLFRATRGRTLERLEGSPAPACAPTAEERLEARTPAERFDALWPSAWARLEPDERAAVLLKHRGGLAQRVAARLLGVSEPTLTRLLQRAIAKLRGAIVDVLRAEGSEPSTREGWTRLEATLACRLEIERELHALQREPP